MSDEKRKEFENFMRRVGGDPELRGKLQADPSGVLEAQGVGVPQGTEVRVIEDSADVRHFVLPADPNATLSDDIMTAVAGGVCVPAGGGGDPIGSTHNPFADYFTGHN